MRNSFSFNRRHLVLTIPILLLLLLITTVNSRNSPFDPSDLISDGVHNNQSLNQTASSPFHLALKSSAEETCEQTYGFLPCTTTVIGNLFLILVYGYLMFFAATYLSSGSELLLQILGPGIIGGLFLPVLGALPDALLILVSGLSGSTETAQSQVSVGMGLLAGSTVMLLTVIWGSCVVVGKCDMSETENSAIDRKDTKRFSLTGSGVSTDIWTCYAARIMAISVLPFIVVQLLQTLHSTSGRHLAVLIGLILSLAILITYCLYQVFQPWIQERKLEYTRHKLVMSGILKHLKQRALGRLLTDDSSLDENVVKKLFHTIDENGDGRLSASELKALVIGIRFEEIDFDKDDAVSKLIKDFDRTNDNHINMEEFINGIKKWLGEAMRVGGGTPDPGPRTHKYLDNFHDKTKKAHALLGSKEPGEGESDGGVKNPRWTSFKASLMLLAGAVIAAAFADPLVDAVDNFSDATSIPTFFISFIALPLATNSSEAVSAIIFASRKKVTTASLTFSELYGAVTMNNVLCLSVFLALVYFRELTWDFSAEVLVICIVCIVMGAFASFRTTFPLWTSFLAYFLYPFSLVLVYVLDYVLGWS
ncbi:sodium/calcium exchanger NCL [Populus nigra]|uniref:sodium/calcium exchanger NCL n=1 Tax=Populus nigra TaxID=3691 RepID=UPI002B26F793|nr:sodium/calcium exchanger NCL [Populus nigra]